MPPTPTVITRLSGFCFKCQNSSNITPSGLLEASRMMLVLLPPQRGGGQVAFTSVPSEALFPQPQQDWALVVVVVGAVQSVQAPTEMKNTRTGNEWEYRFRWCSRWSLPEVLHSQQQRGGIRVNNGERGHGNGSGGRQAAKGTINVTEWRRGGGLPGRPATADQQGR